MAAPSNPPASSSPLIAVADRAAHAFTPPALIQGLASHARGVEVLASHDDRFSARVRSKRTHDVTLRGEAGRLTIACSCPAKSLGMSGCKHAWAALLEVDRRGALSALRDARTPLAVEMVLADAERPLDSTKAKATATATATSRPGIAKASAAARPKRGSSERPRSKATDAKAPPPAPPKKRARGRARE